MADTLHPNILHNSCAKPARNKLFPLTRFFCLFVFFLLCLHSVPAFAEGEENNLLLRLNKLEQQIHTLQVKAASDTLSSSTPSLFDLSGDQLPRTKLRGWFRTGLDYNRFISQTITSAVGGDAEQSLRRLDELLAKVEEIVDDSGSPDAEALLVEARFYRNEAAVQLAVGEENEALQNMSISESFALAAARVAGEEITAADKDVQWDVFSEANLEWFWHPSPKTRLHWTNRLREGDEYFQEWLETAITHKPTDRLELRMEHDFRIRDYQDRLLDDFLDSDLWTQMRYKPRQGMTLSIENRLEYKSEYRSDIDEGYWIESPRLEMEWTWGRFQRLEFVYDWRGQWFHEREDQDFNSDRHWISALYDYYGRIWRLNLNTEQIWKRYRKELNEDDYREFNVMGDLEFDLTEWLALGVRGEVESRRYELLEETNTDYEEYTLTPSLKMQWIESLTQTLRYEWTNRTHRDRDGTDSLEKKIGDFDQHRLMLDLWWFASDALSCSFTVDREWRWYRHGQTGEYEFFLPDYRPISNYSRTSYSSTVDYNLTETIRFSGSVYYAREEHDRYSSFDQEETTFNCEVRIRF